jgi:hypothetical protein
MNGDLATKLQITPKTGVAGVTGVAGEAATCRKPLKLQQLRPPPVKIDKVVNDAIQGVARPAAILASPEEAEFEDRNAMAAGTHLDARTRLQCEKPISILDEEWQLAINDAGRFLDSWGGFAVEFQWSAGDLLDVPHDGKSGGLISFLGGESVQAIGLGAWLRKTAAASTGLKVIKETQIAYQGGTNGN